MNEQIIYLCGRVSIDLVLAVSDQRYIFIGIGYTHFSTYKFLSAKICANRIKYQRRTVCRKIHAYIHLNI